MDFTKLTNTHLKIVYTSVVFTSVLFAATLTNAGGLSANVQAKVDTYKQKLTTWAKDPIIINAIKQANKSTTSMNNAKWKDLSKADPTVLKFQSSSAGKKLTGWQADKNLGKLFLRDDKGNLVAGSIKPAVFNISGRPAFTEVMRGKSWHSAAAKEDVTTKVSSIQLSIPVIDGGKSIGVIHTSIVTQ